MILLPDSSCVALVAVSAFPFNAALIVAGVSANGVTEVYNLGHIDRGYENIEEKFKSLGADITRIHE